MALTPAQRKLRARKAAATRWSRIAPADRAAATAPARRAFLDRFEDAADPDNALRAHMLDLHMLRAKRGKGT